MCRTGSKLGISPLMLAAMNGHTSTVKLLLDMGSDINAQVHVHVQWLGTCMYIYIHQRNVYTYMYIVIIVG